MSNAFGCRVHRRYPELLVRGAIPDCLDDLPARTVRSLSASAYGAVDVFLCQLCNCVSAGGCCLVPLRLAWLHPSGHGWLTGFSVGRLRTSAVRVERPWPGRVICLAELSDSGAWSPLPRPDV